MKVKVDEVPQAEQALITNLWLADEQTGGRPQLPSGQEELALAWFQRVIVESECLLPHVDLLQRLSGGKFARALPRWMVRSDDVAERGGSASGFRHGEPLPKARALDIAERGPNALSECPDELATLLLNPMALWDLADLVYTVFPKGWLSAIRTSGQELMDREGVVVFIPGVDDVADAPGPKQPPSP